MPIDVWSETSRRPTDGAARRACFPRFKSKTSFRKMSRNISCIVTGLALGLAVHSTPAAALQAVPYRLVLERISIDSSISLDVRIYEPVLNSRQSKLVIIAPGSDGAVQPEEDEPGMPDAPHFLSERLAQDGITVVRYSNRGYRDPARCLDGLVFTHANYVDYCVDQRVRAQADFKAADEDFIAAWRWSLAYATSHKFERTAIIGISEGMSHVAHVAAYAHLASMPLIFIGGAQESQHDIVRWQLGNTFLLDRAAALVDQSKIGWVKDEDVAKGALGSSREIAVKKINEVFRIDYIDAKRVKEARVEQKQIVDKLTEQLMATPFAFRQYAVRHDGTRYVAFNTGWWQEMLSDTVSSIDRLVGAGASNVTLVYGALDPLVPIADYQARPCPFRCIYLDDIGHVLGDRTGPTMPWAVEVVVKALNDVWR